MYLSRENAGEIVGSDVSNNKVRYLVELSLSRNSPVQ
jgi:hypothetical protein